MTERLCRVCGQRPAKYIDSKGEFKSDDEHDMCQQCFRSAQQSMMAGVERSHSERPRGGMRRRSRKFSRKRKAGVL